MKIICDCGNEFWLPEMSSREVDSKGLLEFLALKVTNVKHATIPNLEVQYVICACGRKCIVAHDPVEAHLDKPFCYDELRRRGGSDRAAMEYPERYSVDLLDKAIAFVKDEDLINAAKTFDKLAKDLVEGAPFPPADAGCTPAISGNDPGDENEGG